MVNVFKKQLLTSYSRVNVSKSNNSEENIAFVNEQISKKDKVIDSLLKVSAIKAKWFNTT